MPVTVVTRFKPSDAYKADPSCAIPGMKMISGIEGVSYNAVGSCVEDSDIGYSIQIGDSIETYTKVRDDTEFFNSILAKTSITRIGEIEQYHLVTITDANLALVGPLTEVTMFSLTDPTPENKALFTEICSKWAEITEGKFTFGWTLEDPNKAFVIAAWDSVEAHEEHKKLPDAAGPLETLQGITESPGPHHVKLTTVEK